MQLKVVSLNVWDGGRIFDPMVEFLRQEAADIYLLQEVYDNERSELEPRFRAYQELQNLLNMPYASFAPAYFEVIDGQRFKQGNAVLSKFPLTDVSTQFYERGLGDSPSMDRTAFPFIPRNLQHVIADLGEKTIHILNTQGIWGEDGRDSSRRMEMSKKIIAELGKVPQDESILLAGDTNVEPDTETIRMIEAKLFRLFRNELTTSFNTKRKDLVKYPGYAKSVVDMMFVSKNINVLSHYCPQVDVSDHLPLVATIEI